MLLRCLLRLIETPYAWAMRLRNRAYDRGKKTIHQAAVPVISVGNLTLGGTGKTPMVAWIARLLRGQGTRVAIISRGYGAAEGGPNDEAMQLERQLPDVPHLQNPERYEAAKIAVEELEMEVLVLDDGFQHRRLARDIDIVLIDALEPFGFGHVFPRGTLREPLEGFARADVVALSRADMLDETARQTLREKLAKLAPEAIWIETCHAPRALVSFGGEETPATVEAIQANGPQRIAAFCGLGNPAGFRHTLQSLGLEIAAFREFPDHHLYDADDVASLTDWATKLDVEMIVCTMKDLVKIGLDQFGQVPLRALEIELAISEGEEAFAEKIQGCMAPGG